MAPTPTRVLARQDLARGAKVGLRIAGARLLLVDLDGEVFAFEDRCPHQGVSLSEGRVVGRTLVCRVHEWTFDAATGACLAWDSPAAIPDDTCLKTFAVTVEDGWIWVVLNPG